ncbi:SDR family oxidoreductase [Bacillus sp. JCM 19041]|uniref:SDR family oxidoreductase n=1 Tax=Bacillus sp. JCM 19041 TaxID=1460637 RepID=UPI0018D0F41A
MSKAAIVNFTKGIAELVAGSKITANSLLPGPTLTEDTERKLKQMAKDRGETFEEMLIRKHNSTSTINRFIRTEEMAAMAVFLASDKAAAITGAAIRVEGGILLTI